MAAALTEPCTATACSARSRDRSSIAPTSHLSRMLYPTMKSSELVLKGPGTRSSTYETCTHRPRRARHGPVGRQLRGHRRGPRPLPAPPLLLPPLPGGGGARDLPRRPAAGLLAVDPGSRTRAGRGEVRAAVHRDARGDAGRAVLAGVADPGGVHRAVRGRRPLRTPRPPTAARHGGGARRYRRGRRRRGHLGPAARL